MPTEMHLNEDEWTLILSALREYKRSCSTAPDHFSAWMDSVILKVEIGLQVETE